MPNPEFIYKIFKKKKKKVTPRATPMINNAEANKPVASKGITPDGYLQRRVISSKEGQATTNEDQDTQEKWVREPKPKKVKKSGGAINKKHLTKSKKK